MVYSVLAPTERHKKRRLKKNGMESAPMQWPRERNRKPGTSQTAIGGRNGGYVIYLPSLPPNNARSSLTGLMKRIYSHSLTRSTLYIIYETVISIVRECNKFSVKWSLLEISGSLAAGFASWIDPSLSTVP